MSDNTYEEILIDEEQGFGQRAFNKAVEVEGNLKMLQARQNSDSDVLFNQLRELSRQIEDTEERIKSWKRSECEKQNDRIKHLERENRRVQKRLEWFEKLWFVRLYKFLQPRPKMYPLKTG